VATYPREVTAFNSLGAALIRLGQFDNSIAPLREAIRIDPKFTPAYGNLAASLLALGRYADARAILRDAADRKLDFNGARRLSYLLAFVEGDAATMARELEASIGIDETNAAFGWQAHTSAFAGQATVAHEQFRRGVQMSLQGGFREVAAQLGIEDAETHAIVGQCPDARREISEGLALSRDNSTLEHASRVLALCGGADDAIALANEVGRRFPQATLANRVSRPVTAAILAIERGDANRALELLEPIRPYDFAPSAEFWPTYLRGRAYLLRKDGRAAATEFQAIIDRRGVVPTSMLYPLAYVGLARAATLSNDVVAADAAYEKFLALWNGADTSLQPVRDVLTERARLANREPLGDPQRAANR
jgi:tetratricopeptide (TPR) repeat protein